MKLLDALNKLNFFSIICRHNVFINGIFPLVNIRWLARGGDRIWICRSYSKHPGVACTKAGGIIPYEALVQDWLNTFLYFLGMFWRFGSRKVTTLFWLNSEYEFSPEAPQVWVSHAVILKVLVHSKTRLSAWKKKDNLDGVRISSVHRSGNGCPVWLPLFPRSEGGWVSSFQSLSYHWPKRNYKGSSFYWEFAWV